MDEKYPHKHRQDATNFLFWLFKGIDTGNRSAMRIFADTAKNCAEQNTKGPYDDLVRNLGSSCPLSLRYETVKLINLLI